MTIRENMVQDFIKRGLLMAKLRSKQKALKLTDDEYQRAELAILEEHIKWLRARRPGWKDL